MEYSFALPKKVEAEKEITEYEIVIPSLLPDRPSSLVHPAFPLLTVSESAEDSENRKKEKKKKKKVKSDKGRRVYGRFYFIEHLVEGFFSRLLARLVSMKTNVTAYARHAILFEHVSVRSCI